MGKKLERFKLAFWHLATAHMDYSSGQALLLTNISKYLLIKDPTGKDNKLLRDKIFRGCCFGFSVIRQTMKLSGKEELEQWKNVLYQISQWDGKHKSLNNVKVIFPRFESPVTLDKAFELICSYVIHSQVISAANDFHLKNIAQDKLLEPHSNYFEILSNNPDEKIKNIQHRKYFSGCFTKRQLVALLDEEQAEKNIYIVSSLDHAIDISYCSENEKWSVHDSNYPHNNVEKMQKTFISKERVADEIINCMNIFPYSLVKKHNDNEILIDIQIASFDINNDISEKKYDELLQNHASAIISHGGLALIARYNPSRIIGLLSNHAFDSTEGRLIFAKALKRENKGFNALFFIVEFDPLLLVEMLNHSLFNESIIIKAFFQGMQKKVRSGHTVLHDMAIINPASLPAMLKLKIFQCQKGEALITKLLPRQIKKDGSTVLHCMAISDPASLPAMLKLTIFQSQEGVALMTKLMQMQIKNGSTVLHTIARLNSQVLIEILKLDFFNSAAGQKIFSKVLQIVDKDNWNILHLICRYNHVDVVELLNLNIFRSEAVRQSLIQSMQVPNQDGWTPIHIASHPASLILPQLFRLNVFAESSTKKLFVKTMHAKSKGDWTPLFFIKNHNPAVLPEINDALEVSRNRFLK